MNVTKRQAQILAAIVREYSRTSKPVGSFELAERYSFNVSPATIRNEMQVLEKAGLIQQPHTSAGRVPTDAGYRLFVNKLMKHLELKEAEQRQIRAELLHLQKQYVELGQSLAKLLASHSQGAGFALLPEGAAAAGLSQVIDEAAEVAEVKQVLRFMDELPREGERLLQQSVRLPVSLSPNFSLLVARVKLPDGQKGVIGIVGPKRMSYARNISLLEYVRKLLAGGLGVVFISWIY